MKKIFIILGFISALISVIFAVTPHFNLAIAPIIIAFVCEIVVFLLSTKQKSKTKFIQYIFLLVIIALVFTIYKNVNSSTEITNTEQLEQLKDETSEDSEKNLEELQLDEEF